MKCPPKTPAARAALLLCLSIFSVPLAAQAPESEGTTAAAVRTIDANDPALRRISGRLKCQCGGCTASVQTCPHQMDCGLRMYILNTVKNGLATGKTEDQIVEAIVTEYGPQILLEPPRQGFTMLGWIMPFAALLAGAAAVGLVLWRWKSGASEEKPVAPQQPTSSDSAAQNGLVEKYRAQIDQELEKEDAR